LNHSTRSNLRSAPEQGQAVLLVILGLSLFLIGALGLTIDGGQMYAHRQMAQTAADSAAEAGGGAMVAAESSLLGLVAAATMPLAYARATRVGSRPLLAPASDAQVRRLWKGARVVSLADAGDATFSSAARGDLRGPLLWAALLIALAEMALASLWRRQPR